MTIQLPSFTQKFAGPRVASAAQRSLPWLLWVAVVAALVYQLGAPALFEPDEGRNAEKAREILVLNDWVTPHENFHAVLDKPIFLYWAVAGAYTFFGVSEWAARLPSALAAFACLAAVYRFTHAHWGRWPALWSVLILLTCAEFFVLARTVIFDMMLSFLVTVSLCGFYQALHGENSRHRRLWFYAVSLALGAATLTKGLVGIVVPGMVICGYLLATSRWRGLGKLPLVSGALLFLAIVLPWYLMAEARNPGYLAYYLLDEHFGRFASDEFDRAQPWYYFIGVGLIGFIPWSPLLPLVARDLCKAPWQRTFDDQTVYLISWVVVPFLFFSVSESKLPHYILPIFPALAMLTAVSLVRAYRDAPAKLQRALALTWWLQMASSMYLLSGWLFPEILPRQIRLAVAAMPFYIAVHAIVTSAILFYTTRRNRALPRSQRQLYAVQSMTLALFLLVIVRMMIVISPERSAKAIAEAALSMKSPATSVVQYDTYLAGLAFYLGSERPVWVITRRGKERTLMGNYYAIGKREYPMTPWGKAIFHLDEFHEYWPAAKHPLLVVVKDKNLPRFSRGLGELPVKLATEDEYVLVAKR